jgi:ribosomal protein S18 acetylase RimI-like enzyme
MADTDPAHPIQAEELSMMPPTALWLTLPGSPAIPGLRVRAYGGPEDVPAMAALYRAVNRADGNPEVWTTDELRLDYEDWTNVDPRRDDLLAYVDEDLVALSRIEWVDSNDGRRFYVLNGHVHPDWRRRGLGRAMFRRNEARLAELAAEHGLDRPQVLVTHAEEGDVGASALARAEGYTQARVYHLMLRPDMADILEPPMPHGLQVRPITVAHLPQLWEAMSEAFKDHFGGDDTSPAAYRRWSQDPNLDASLSIVAFDGQDIAGAVMGYIYPEENEEHGYQRGWTDPVFVRRPWRRRGLASALLGRALTALRERGITAAQLGVDSENPHQALTLYQQHRFEVLRTTTEWHKPMPT